MPSKNGGKIDSEGMIGVGVDGRSVMGLLAYRCTFYCVPLTPPHSPSILILFLCCFSRCVPTGTDSEVDPTHSLIQFYPHFERTMRESLRSIVGDDVEKRVDIGLAKDGSGVGGMLSSLFCSHVCFCFGFWTRVWYPSIFPYFLLLADVHSPPSSFLPS